MTNEEKALELFPDIPTMKIMCIGIRDKLVEMCDWKDQVNRHEHVDKAMNAFRNWYQWYCEFGMNATEGKIIENFRKELEQEI